MSTTNRSGIVKGDGIDAYLSSPLDGQKTCLRTMTLLELPPEIRSQVWLECLAVLCPADPRQTDQICATLDCFCGHRYKAFNPQMLPLLLANKRIYADVSTLLGTGTT